MPAGPFAMGSDAAAEHAPDPDEAPRHEVVVPAFRLGRVPVTNAGYREFVRGGGDRPPAHWPRGEPPAGAALHPVTHVSWEEARAFCAWAGGSLPTEAQWERAARGDDVRAWPWGDEAPTPARARHAEAGTAEVGGRPDGAGPFGHLDLAGNVWEWTSSRLSPYPYDAADGREDEGPGPRVVRGGSYIHGPGEVRCSYRQGLLPGVVDPYVGLRLAAAPGVEAAGLLDVPAGRVLLGNDPRPPAGPALPDETPAHVVTVAAVALSATPVTNAQYQAFVRSTGHPPPGHWAEGGGAPPRLADHPVTHVDWHDAAAFCAWAGGRLPTEAEWEKAARGPDGRLYPWGSEEPDASRANVGAGLKRGSTSAVGAHPAGASPYGLHDMAGNVWEWVSTAYRPYPYRADDGREDVASEEERVLRGGSYASPTARHVRCASRSRSHRGRRAAHIGFRVAGPAVADPGSDP